MALAKGLLCACLIIVALGNGIHDVLLRMRAAMGVPVGAEVAIRWKLVRDDVVGFMRSLAPGPVGCRVLERNSVTKPLVHPLHLGKLNFQGQDLPGDKPSGREDMMVM